MPLPIRIYDGTEDEAWKNDPEFPCFLCGEVGYVQTKTTESSCGGYDNFYHRCAACAGNWKSGDGPDA